MTRLRFFIAAALCLIAAGLSPAAAEQVVRGHGLTARVDTSATCGRSVGVSVEAPDRSAFTGDRIELQRLLGGVRATLAEACPALRALEVTGYADGELAFVAGVTADSGWRVPTELESRVTASPLIEAATTCDYDRDQPFVGCWVQLLPEQFSGLILNVHRDGSWFWERPKALVTGTFEHVGRSIQRDYMIGAGPFLTFTDQAGWNVNFIGPLFRDDCNILKLGPYAPLGVGMFGPTDPQLLVRLRSPQRITIDILRSPDRRFPDGYVGNPGGDEIVVSLPEGKDAFNSCVDNFDEDVEQSLLVNLLFTSLAFERVFSLVPTPVLKQPLVLSRLVKPINPTDNIIGYFTAIDKGPLPGSIASTFRGGSYTAKIVNEDTILYRSFGGDVSASGSYWTRMVPTGPLQSMIDNALDQQNWPKRNNATRIAMARIPKGTRIYEGSVGQQGGLVGGGNQVYIDAFNPKWIVSIR